MRNVEGGLLGALGPLGTVSFEHVPLPIELPTATDGNQGRPLVRRVEVERIDPVNEGENRASASQLLASGLGLMSFLL